MIRATALTAALLTSAVPVLAADQPPPHISVTGQATVRTPPDVATIVYSVHGEGTTADEAAQMLVDKRKRIDGGLGAIAGAVPALGGEVAIREVRSPDCGRQNYGQPRLSTGACAIIGYTADLQLTMKTRAVDKAPTMVGLIGRLGGTDPRVDGYGLADDAPAHRAAVTRAFADARQRAETLATGAGVQLGTLLSANEGGGTYAPQDIVVTGTREVFAPPPPPPPPPPIGIDAKPQPIETRAQVSVTYAIGGTG